MTQFCIEEATMVAYETQLAAAAEQEEAASRPQPQPGEVTDPVMQHALAKAKEMHAATFGVQT